jgi:hypothetical protein
VNSKDKPCSLRPVTLVRRQWRKQEPTFGAPRGGEETGSFRSLPGTLPGLHVLYPVAPVLPISGYLCSLVLSYPLSLQSPSWERLGTMFVHFNPQGGRHLICIDEIRKWPVRLLEYSRQVKVYA